MILICESSFLIDGRIGAAEGVARAFLFFCFFQASTKQPCRRGQWAQSLSAAPKRGSAFPPVWKLTVRLLVLCRSSSATPFVRRAACHTSGLPQVHGSAITAPRTVTRIARGGSYNDDIVHSNRLRWLCKMPKRKKQPGENKGRQEKTNVPPWIYRILEPDTKAATVCVRLLVADLPSQGRANESIEALVEIPWEEDREEQAMQRDALLRLQALIQAEIERLNEQYGAVESP